MLSVNYAECRKQAQYAECHNAKCHFAECRYAKCHYAECRFAKCHYAEYRYAECRGAVNCEMKTFGSFTSLNYSHRK